VVRARPIESTLLKMSRTRFSVAALWLAIVLFMGASYFAANKTAVFILPILKFLAPHASIRQLHAIHTGIRKIAHVTEYAILAVLWFKALVLSARRTPRVAAWVALSVCLLCAFADEAHQSTLPMRTGSASDFVIDSLGAVAALILVRARRTPPDRTTPLGTPVAVEVAD
jgi:VanZ family protein